MQSEFSIFSPGRRGVSGPAGHSHRPSVSYPGVTDRPGIGSVESDEPQAEFLLQSARQAPIFAQDFGPSQPEFLSLSPGARTVTRPSVHACSAQSGISETRARVFNAMSHSALLQASSLRWNQLPGVSGWTPQGTSDRTNDRFPNGG